MTEDRAAWLNQRLADIHDRLAWIATTEASAALVNGYGANGEFDAERTRLTEESDLILHELR